MTLKHFPTYISATPLELSWGNQNKRVEYILTSKHDMFLSAYFSNYLDRLFK